MVRESRSEADVRILREALTALAERQGLGVVVVDKGGAVVFASQRARRLLGPSTALPVDIQRFIEGTSGKDDSALRLMLPGTTHSVNVRATGLPGMSRNLMITLEEEAPRTNLAKNLIDQYGLSARSVQLVQLASRGLKNKEIGDKLRLSEATVKTYMHSLFRELGVRNRAELVALAERMAKQEKELDLHVTGSS